MSFAKKWIITCIVLGAIATVLFLQSHMFVWYFSFLDTSSSTENPEIVYNRALTLAKQQEYREAWNILSGIALHDAQFYELSGDILWQGRIASSSGEIAKWYTQAEELQSNPRLQYKLSLLQQTQPENTNTDTSENTTENQDTNKALQNTLEQQKNRSEALNPLPTDIATEREEYRRLKYIIES